MWGTKCHLDKIKFVNAGRFRASHIEQALLRLLLGVDDRQLALQAGCHHQAFCRYVPLL